MSKKEDKKADDKKEEKKDAAAKADGEGAEGATEEGGKKKLPMKMIIIIAVAAVVLLGGIAAALVFTGVLGGAKKADAAKEQADGHGGEAKPDAHGEAKEGEAKEGEHGDGKEHGPIFYDMGEVVVNLQTDGKRQVFLKLVIQLELKAELDKATIEQIKPRIIDNFQTYLRELRLDDLRGSAGLYRLREELLFRVTEAAQPVKIKDVLIQQMLVQ